MYAYFFLLFYDGLTISSRKFILLKFVYSFVLQWVNHLHIKRCEYDQEIPQAHTAYREKEPQNTNSHKTPGRRVE